jgi:hypothetical protein
MKIMNIIGMNVQGRKMKDSKYFLIRFFLNRWIRYEEDFDVEMQRWQGLNSSNSSILYFIYS